MGHVIPLGNPEQHFWLTRSVARSLGVNLSEAMADGRLSAQAYTEMVTKCRQCPMVSACQEWLGREGCQATAAPEHCVNADLLNRLRR